MAEKKDSLTSALGILSGNDMKNLQQILPFMNPIVSPWMTLGAGALMGMYSQHQAKKDRDRAVKLNAKMMQLSPWTGMGPEQVSFQDPSAVGHILGGIGAAQGVAKSINQHAPAYNVWKHLRDKKEALARANNPYENPDFVGPPTKEQWEEFDPTLTIEQARKRKVGNRIAARRELGEDPYEDDPHLYKRERDADKYKGNIQSPYVSPWLA